MSMYILDCEKILHVVWQKSLDTNRISPCKQQQTHLDLALPCCCLVVSYFRLTRFQSQSQANKFYMYSRYRLNTLNRNTSKWCALNHTKCQFGRLSWFENRFCPFRILRTNSYKQNPYFLSVSGSIWMFFTLLLEPAPIAIFS